MQACHIFKTIGRSLGSEDEVVANIKSPSDAVALVVHAWAVESGLWFNGHSSEPSLPHNWRKGGPKYYEFKYETQSNRSVDLTVTRLGPGKLQVSALVYDSETSQDEASFNVPVDPAELINKAFFDHPDGSEETRDAFAGDAAVESLCQRLSQAYSQACSQANQKPQLAEPSQPALLQATADSAYSRASTPQDTPLAPQRPPVDLNVASPASLRDRGSRPDLPPDFDDEYEMLAGPRQLGGRDGQNVGQFGDHDLYPPGLGPHPILRPSLGPGAPMGGMHPTFGDPLFQGRGGRGSGSDGRPGPPGSRWDMPGPGLGRGGNSNGFNGSGPNGYI